jgi:hypothetical protein
LAQLVSVTWRVHLVNESAFSVSVGYFTVAIHIKPHAEKRGRNCNAHVGYIVYILIMKAEMRSFSDLFDKVLYMFQTCPLSITTCISTLYTHNRYLSF